jgi:Predicted membrane protein
MAPPNSLSGKNKVVAALLAIFLGSFGIHHFYLGNTMIGVIYLLFFWTAVPGIIGFVEGIIYLTMSDERFYEKYGA